MARSAVALSTANVIWEIETDPGMWQAMIASWQTILNRARESGQSVAEYSWSTPWGDGRFFSARTEFDLDRMVSTSTTVGGLDDEKRIRAIQIVRSDTVGEPMP
jgi:hypothetical protein